jgi:hypothetical protein
MRYFQLYSGNRQIFAMWADDLPGNFDVVSNAQATLDAGGYVNLQAITQQLA